MAINLGVKVEQNPDLVKDRGANPLIITKSGMYDLFIDTAYVTESKVNNSKALILNLVVKDAKDADNKNATKQTLFNVATLKNADGKDNVSGLELLQKLGNILDIETYDETETKQIKTYTELTVEAIPELEGAIITARVQQEFDTYGANDDKISEKFVIKNVFRYKDKASAQELVNGLPKKDDSKQQDTYLGKQYEIECAMEGINDSVYKGKATAEKVQEYKKNNSNKNKEKQTTPKRKMEDNMFDDDESDDPF